MTAAHLPGAHSRPNAPAWMLAGATAVAVYVGWRSFWFLTDDAFIAFRYASNSIAGHGYVWNPPPFPAVEGYTSFLWVLLLETVWRVTDVAPPQSANWISLGFGAVSLVVVARMFLRMKLPASVESARLALLAVALLGIVSNRTFLAWLSSGLDTSLFNFWLIAWICLATRRGRVGAAWILAISSCATLAALARPEGLVVATATLGLIALELRASAPGRASWAAALPLLGIPLHVGWRVITYGAWLPNTYYAKHVAAWPESGARYLASFALEYGLWFWAALGLAALAVGAARARSEPREAIDPTTRLRCWLTIAAVVWIVGNYTFLIGGDHFEYRIYSYTVPLLFLSGAWFAAQLTQRPAPAIALLSCFVLVSWPIPWTHWWQSRGLETRIETKTLVLPIAPYFPPPLDSLVAVWDAQQAWLIPRAVGVRHQEHKIFQRYKSESLPTREEGSALPWSARHVVAQNAVGLVGWMLPNVAVIDMKGLNDAVIARSGKPVRTRKMGHDRIPPDGYVQCFKPNVMVGNGTATYRRRQLSDLEIEMCHLRR